MRNKLLVMALVVVCFCVGFSLARSVIQIQQEQKPLPKPKPTPGFPLKSPPPSYGFQFGPPPAPFTDLWDLPFTETPPEVGSPEWFKALPPLPDCTMPWDPEVQPQCKRVLNYI